MPRYRHMKELRRAVSRRSARWILGGVHQPVWVEDDTWQVVLHPEGGWTMALIITDAHRPARMAKIDGHSSWEWAT